MDCARCGTCCVAPDIAALDKPLGARCAHLGADLRCRRYGERPEVCRAYRPGPLCAQVRAPGLEERVARYLALFGLEGEAARARGARSMAEARRRG
jgi:uncharacterized protein